MLYDFNETMWIRDVHLVHTTVIALTWKRSSELVLSVTISEEFTQLQFCIYFLLHAFIFLQVQIAIKFDRLIRGKQVTYNDFSFVFWGL
jgi:hypothetical protein